MTGINPGWRIGALGAGLALLTVAVCQASPLGPNLLPAGDFESWTNGLPAGWTPAADKGACAVSEAVCATGRRSAMLTLPAGGGSVRLRSDAVAVSEGFYLVRFMMRVEGLSRGKPYEGGQAGLFLDWLDAQQRVLLHEYLAWSYVPMALAYRDQIRRVPAGAAALRVVVEILGNEQMPLDSTAWFDDVAVCRYTPPTGIGEKAFSEWSVSDGRNVLRTPDAPGWGYLAGVDAGHSGESVQGVRVRDGAALFGSAMHTRPGVPPGLVYHSAYTVEQPPGLYRVVVRARIPAAYSWKAEAPVLSVDALHSSAGVRGGRAIRAADFTKPGEYEEFAFDLIKPTTGWVTYRVSTPGGAVESWLDLVRVVQLVRFRDPDLLEWYPGLAGALAAGATAPGSGGARRALLVEGLLGSDFHCREALARGGWETVIASTTMNAAGGGVVGYPGELAGLCSNRLVILANASLESLGPDQRFQLRAFVERGGGLLLLGGKSAFGNGGIRGSFLEEVVPVQVAETRFDIEASRAELLATPAAAAWRLALDKGVVAPFRHQAQVKPGGELLVRAGREPLLVAGTFGRGRVLCLLATPYGQAPARRTRLTAWSGYPDFIDAMLNGLAKGDAP